MGVVTATEYENGPLIERRNAVAKFTGEFGYQPKPTWTMEQWERELTQALSMRSPIESAMDADFSFLTRADSIPAIRQRLRDVCDEPQFYKERSVPDDQQVVAAAVELGLEMSDNFGVVLIGKGASTFDDMDAALKMNGAYDAAKDIHQGKYNQPQTAYVGRQFKGMKTAGTSEILLRKLEIQPDNFSILSLHGGNPQVAQTILHVIETVRSLGLSAHFNAFVKPSPQWEGVFHNAEKAK